MVLTMIRPFRGVKGIWHSQDPSFHSKSYLVWILPHTCASPQMKVRMMLVPGEKKKKDKEVKVVEKRSRFKQPEEGICVDIFYERDSGEQFHDM